MDHANTVQVGPAEGSNWGRWRAISVLGLMVFGAFLAVAGWVFIMAQILPPQDVWLAPVLPFTGFYGETAFLPGVSYTVLLEGSGAVSFIGLLLYSLSRQTRLAGARKVLASLGLPLEVFGAMVGGIVYTETHLLWGELWYGVKLFNLSPQGFPWGNERVASNTCLLHGADYVPSYGANCWFFNYDELLLVCVAAVILGVYLSRRYDQRSGLGSQVAMKFIPNAGSRGLPSDMGRIPDPYSGSTRFSSLGPP